MEDKEIDFNSKDSLLEILVLFTKLYHKPYSAESLIRGLPLNTNLTEQTLFEDKKSSKSLFSRAAGRAGLKSILIKKSLKKISDLQLPMILILKNNSRCILDSFSKDRKKAKIIFAEEGGLESWVDFSKLTKEYLGFGYLLKQEFQYEQSRNILDTSKQRHWFWNTLGLSRKIYFDCILASLLINIFLLATPLFTMNVYDRVIPTNAHETLLVFTIGILIVFLLDVFLKSIRVYFLEIAAKKSDIIMSSIIFEKVLDLKLEQHPKSIGSFSSILKRFDSIRHFLANSTLSVIIDLPFAILFLAVIFYLAGAMVFVPIVIISIIFIYAFFIKNPLRKSIENTFEASSKKNGILIESLQNIETVKAFGMAGKIQWNWEEATGEIANKGLKSKLLSASIPNVMAFLTNLNTVRVVVFGAFQIQRFELTMGGLIATMILSSRAIAPMGRLVGLITNFEDTKSSYVMLNELVNKPIEHPIAKEFVKRPSLNGDIEFRNVTFKYPESESYALQDVSFTIKQGEKVAIIGKIGSGKSTIAKLILKFYKPESGQILIDGIDIDQINPSDLRKSIGYVPQEIQLFRGTVKENILTSNKFFDDSVAIERAKVSTSEDFIKLHPLGYDMPIGERGVGISGGQKQSIGLARALINKPEILLFDEPTNAMDQGSENKVLFNLVNLDFNPTLLLVTQKMGMVDLVDRIIVMSEGKKALDGKKEEIIKCFSKNNIEIEKK